MDTNKEKYYNGLSDVLFYKTNDILIEIEPLIKNEDLIYFISYNYLNYPETYLSHYLMYQLKNRWELLTLEDWRKIVEQLIENELSIIGFITFFYTIFEIDMLIEAEKISLEKKISIENIKSFYKKGFVKAQLDKYLFLEYERNSITKDFLLRIQSNLLNQGAIKAIVREPEIIHIEE